MTSPKTQSRELDAPSPVSSPLVSDQDIPELNGAFVCLGEEEGGGARGLKYLEQVRLGFLLSRDHPLFVFRAIGDIAASFERAGDQRD